VNVHLGGGRDLVAIPGPSVVPDRVLAAMHRPMPDIYQGELLEKSDEIFEILPGIARTTTARPFITISNGHGAWEMAITNTMSKGDLVLVLESGIFAGVWGTLAKAVGVRVETLRAPARHPVDLDGLEARLDADADRNIKALLVVHSDTASSVRNDIAGVRSVLDRLDHPALLMVDCIASLGCERYEMDAWGVDVTVGASQKGLMTPPGLALVFAGERALAAHRSAELRTGYWDWTARMTEGAHYLRYAGTPPASMLFGFHEALTMILEEGLSAVWERHVVLGSAVRAAVEAWSVAGGLELNIIDPQARSNAVTTVLAGEVDVDTMRELCRTRAGLTLGVGIGFGIGLDGEPLPSFRIGHMGHIDPPMILGTIGTVEATLQAIGAPIGTSGVAAAATVVGAALSS
jgi:alanine-glyoxylate transaminase/serine-glyoxylate transaminase/serine-pyruvate transaminase